MLVTVHPDTWTNNDAEVEVADLIRESGVVRMRSPDHTCLLRRGAVHGMEVVGKILASCPRWGKKDLTKPITRAGCHRTVLRDECEIDVLGTSKNRAGRWDSTLSH